MSDSNKQDLNSQAVPFFARYLEGQVFEDLSEEEMNRVRGGYKEFDPKLSSGLKLSDDIVTTMKYPSDQEDAPVTMKYPSDGDDDLPPEYFQ